MAIKVKAIERNVSFEKNTEKWTYELQPDPSGMRAVKLASTFGSSNITQVKWIQKKTNFLELTFIIDTIFFHIMRFVNN